MTRALISLSLALGLGAAMAGCRSDSDRNRTQAMAGTAPTTSAATPVPGAGPTGPGAGPAGVVSRLTGDDDSEVTPQLEQIVFDALARDVDDAPLEGF